MHIDYTDLPANPEKGVKVVRFTLTEGDSAIDPTHQKRRIYGPCTVEYGVWSDGSIDCRVHRPKEKAEK